jgi:hypothetical protein
MMCNPGTKEGVTVKEGRFSKVWPANEKFLTALRKKDALVGVAIDPLTAHECGNQRYLSILWLDACLTERLPEDPTDSLRPMPTEGAWLAPFLEEVATAETEFTGDKSQAGWLPSQDIAKAWMHYVKDTAIPDMTPPSAPENVKANRNLITWDAEADLESGIGHFIIKRDGKVIGNVPENSKNPFGRPVFQGLQYSDTPVQPLVKMQFKDKTAEADRKYEYEVISVNTVGLKSR